MTYDTKEAARALAKLSARSERNKQIEAAKVLLQELAEVPKPADLDIAYNTKNGSIELEAHDGRARRVWFAAMDGRFKVSGRFQDEGIRNLDVAIEYDPATDRFVGTEVDTTIVPTPGQRYPMRDALVVVIEAIVKDLVATK